MLRRWTEKSVDLGSLSNYIDDFFKSRGFSTKRNESGNERAILLRPKYSAIKLEAPINVRITGNSDDFTIDIKASELTTRSIRVGMLTKSIGGGYFLLKGLKMQEELEKLEKEFWIYIENKVTQLTGSAQPLPE